MTGIRIAATLGGFFGLMVFLIIYKSRGETHDTMKALKVCMQNAFKCCYYFRNEKLNAIYEI